MEHQILINSTAETKPRALQCTEKYIYYLSFQSKCAVTLIAFVFSFSADIISTVEFNHTGELLATGDKGGRVVIFQREQEVSGSECKMPIFFSF